MIWTPYAIAELVDNIAWAALRLVVPAWVLFA